MRVDYDGVGGVGIRIPDELIEKLGNDSEESLSKEEIVESIGVEYVTYSDAYSGRVKYAWVMPETKFSDCVQNAEKWVSELNDKLGDHGKYTNEDLEVISELFIY